MEELLPIVGKLAEKYTAGESTSVTYEKAEQLMGAVLYSIRELEEEGRNQIVSADGMTARKAYEMGASCVEKKVKLALILYHKVLAEFDSYGNRCLADTFVKGMPEFFKWYDMKYAPQDTILTLDYPVLCDLSGYSGIDKIYEYIACIRLEQRFLRAFPREYILDTLREYDNAYEDIIGNLCEIMLAAVAGQMYAGKSMYGSYPAEEDFARIREKLSAMETPEVSRQIGKMTAAFVKDYCKDDEALSAYLALCADDIAVRLKAV